MQTKNPEDMARAVVEACADCDICRYLMESTSCKVFPELYRLFDKEAAKTGRITPAELKGLVDLCNFCALCPCPNIRGDLMKAKHAFVDRETASIDLFGCWKISGASLEFAGYTRAWPTFSFRENGAELF